MNSAFGAMNGRGLSWAELCLGLKFCTGEGLAASPCLATSLTGLVLKVDDNESILFCKWH